jgi:excinuclease ABC subunit A
MQDKIIIKGAREHNLKNIDLSVPKNKLVVFTGLSGSGKSSMAFDTIYAEGQRRYVESLSSYARQFLGIMDKPDVDQITGLSPAISIDQKSTSHNPRSTVGTVTEIYDYLRLLFARIGHPHCPICGREIAHLSSQTIVEQILELASANQSGSKPVRLLILSPVVRARKGTFSDLFASLLQKGYTKVRVDKKIIGLADDILLLKNNKHDIDVVIDKLVIGPKPDSELRTRLFDSVESALRLSEGLCIASIVQDKSFDFPDKPTDLLDTLYSERFACPVDNISLPEIEPRIFSFNSPQGACATCTGLGTLLKLDPDLILNPKLTISEGGILPYANTFTYDSWFAKKIGQFVPLKTPLKDFSKSQTNLLLYGNPKHPDLSNEHLALSSPQKFEGIIPNLFRRHKETNSDFIRAEIEKYMRKETCPDCKGLRLKPEVLGITVSGKSIIDVSSLAIDKTLEFIQSLDITPSDPPLESRGGRKGELSTREETIAKPILKEISARLGFLISVGLDYLTLDRTAVTLSGGEAQRIRLASQIGSGLSGVLYVLDEPSIGLHQRDNQKLIDTLKHLRDLGNSVLVVEHDADMMLQSDWLIDFGPGAGEHGGKVISAGTPSEVSQDPNSLTGKYLSGKKTISRKTTQLPPLEARGGAGGVITLSGVSEHNLKNVNLEIPLGKLVCITGVSGSGKSTCL